MLFAVIHQLFTAEDFIVGGVDGNQFAVSVSGVKTFAFAIQRQTGTHFTGVLDGGFQFDILAINDPNHALFTNTTDVNGVRGIVSYQLTRLQRAHLFRALTIIQHQTTFHLARFGIYRRDRTVYGVTKPQRLSRVIDGGTKRLEIVMDRLRHFQSDRIKTINHTTFIQFAALRSGEPQRVFLLAISHFVGTFTYRFTQHFFCGLRTE